MGKSIVEVETMGEITVGVVLSYSNATGPAARASQWPRGPDLEAYLGCLWAAKPCCARVIVRRFSKGLS